MIEWPSALAGKTQSLIADSNFAPIDTNVRTKMAAGPDRVRRGSGVLRYEINWTQIFTQDELDVFMAFYATVLDHGAKFFSMDNIMMVKSYEVQKYQFVAPYNVVARYGNGYKVSAKFVVVSVNLLTANDLLLVEEFGIGGVEAMAAAIGAIDLEPSIVAWEAI